MIFDLIGITTTIVVKCLCRQGEQKQHIFNEIEKLFAFTDKTETPCSSCGVSIFGDKNTALQIINENKYKVQK